MLSAPLPGRKKKGKQPAQTPLGFFWGAPIAGRGAEAAWGAWPRRPEGYGHLSACRRRDEVTGKCVLSALGASPGWAITASGGPGLRKPGLASDCAGEMPRRATTN